MVRMLIAKGARRCHQDASGETALHWAARRSLRPVVETLLNYLVDGNQVERVDAGVQADVFNMICALNQRQRKAHEIAPDRGVAEEILKAYHCVPSMYRPRTAPKPEKPKPVIKP